MFPRRRCPASVRSVAGWPSSQPRHDRLVDVDVRPRVIEIGDDDDRACAARPSRRHRCQLRGHDAGDRRLHDRVGDVLVERRRSARRPRPRRARARGDLLRPRTGAKPRDASPTPRARRSRAALTCATATSRLRRRIVALLARAGVRLQQRFEALQIRSGGLELGLRRRTSACAESALRPRLADVFGARARLEQLELRVRLIAVGLGAAQGELERPPCRAARRARPRRRGRPPRPPPRSRVRRPRARRARRSPRRIRTRAGRAAFPRRGRCTLGRRGSTAMSSEALMPTGTYGHAVRPSSAISATRCMCATTSSRETDAAPGRRRARAGGEAGRSRSTAAAARRCRRGRGAG